jgi:hypothetical protein
MHLEAVDLTRHAARRAWDQMAIEAVLAPVDAASIGAVTGRGQVKGAGHSIDGESPAAPTMRDAGERPDRQPSGLRGRGWSSARPAGCGDAEQLREHEPRARHPIAWTTADRSRSP